MTGIKLCGLMRPCDIRYVNELLPEYIGFVFAPESRRYVSPEYAETLRAALDDRITPVGVFTDEKIEVIAGLVQRHVIDAVQLHGKENEQYIAKLKKAAACPVIKAFRIAGRADIAAADRSMADHVLLDSGGGTGTAFDHSLIQHINRPYFLAGGLTAENVGTVIRTLQPYAVDASSSLETNGWKDKIKLTAFVKAVRNT